MARPFLCEKPLRKQGSSRSHPHYAPSDGLLLSQEFRKGGLIRAMPHRHALARHDEDMTEHIDIRESLPSDTTSIEALYPNAFPDEDLLPLVRELLGAEPIVLSLVGIVDETLAGHVIFTTCGIAGGADTVALLGPLAVAAARQRQGVGSALVRAGLRALETSGTRRVYVLGDPAYYGRFGFAADEDVTPPYPLPEEWRGAWQSLSLRGDTPPLCGKLSVPQPWSQRALWAP